MTSILKFYKDLERYGLFKDSQFILNIPIELLNELVDKHQSNLSEKPTSSQTEISDGEIQSTAKTFWTEPSESDMKRGWKLGAKWYREQLKSKQ